MHDAKWNSKLRKKLLKWFDENQRDLPWRKKKSPYRIWVSEIMLQQTQVATVVNYFKRFIKAFPTVKKLAAADQDEVLKLWEGLGYYRRARQMHKSAQVIVEKHGGKFPTDFESVLALPGIGRYTAGAILSIALDRRLPILEGNTIRLYSRLLELHSDPRTSANQNVLWEFAEGILPRQRCGDFNQSLMELGSEICHPRQPQCLICPIKDLCPTRIKGLQSKIPKPKKKVIYQSLEEAAVIVERSGKYLIRKCGLSERWAGLWDFPRYEIESSSKGSSSKSDPESNGDRNGRLSCVESAGQLAAAIKADTGLTVEIGPPQKSLSHAVTRYKIKLNCYAATKTTGRLVKSEGLCWMSLDQISNLAMNGTGRKIAKWLPLKSNKT